MKGNMAWSDKNVGYGYFRTHRISYITWDDASSRLLFYIDGSSKIYVSVSTS